MAYEVLGIGNVIIGEVESMDDEETLLRFYREVEAAYTTGRLQNGYIEVVDEEGNPTNKIKLRDLAHRDGTWHRTFHLHVYSLIENHPCILLQKRSALKLIAPRKFDTAIAGHYDVGEPFDAGMCREAKEELGWVPDLKHTIKLGSRKIRDNPESDDEFRNYEHQNVLLCRSDMPLINYKLFQEEVKGLYRIDLEKFIRMMDNPTGVVDNVEAVELDQMGRPLHTTHTLQRNEIRTSRDEYHLRIALLTYWHIHDARKLELLGENPLEKLADEFPRPPKRHH